MDEEAGRAPCNPLLVCQPAGSPDVDAALRWLLDKMTMQWVVGSEKRSKAAADDTVDAT